MCLFFFFQAEDGIRDTSVTGVQTCALPISSVPAWPMPTRCVSDYLQPYDEMHLVGIGQAGTDVAWENAVRFTGLKISLFNRSEERRVGKECGLQCGR